RDVEVHAVLGALVLRHGDERERRVAVDRRVVARGARRDLPAEELGPEPCERRRVAAVERDRRDGVRRAHAVTRAKRRRMASAPAFIIDPMTAACSSGRTSVVHTSLARSPTDSTTTDAW